MRNIKIYMVLCIGVLLSSCIKNDIPYPEILAEFTDFKVEGQKGEAVIDKETMTVNIPLEEQANPKQIKVVEVKTNEDAKCPIKEGDIINLKKPLDVVLSLYQEYVWTIKAEQNITYNFKIENQVGKSIINSNNHTAMVYVNSEVGRKNINVLELKLGPNKITTLMPAKEKLKDFTVPQTVVAKYNGEEVVWTLAVSTAKSNIFTNAAFPRTVSAWLNGSGLKNEKKGFEYREKGQEEWIVIDPNIVEGNELFTYHLKNLKPATTYEYRAFTEKEKATIEEFTTTEIQELPGADFDNWWLENEKIWNPWAKDGMQIWDTGNMGSSSLGKSNSLPTEETATGKGKAARLESKFVGIGGIGKFAAGNIFVGKFLEVVGTSGHLEFGKPFKAYPTHLKGFFKYNSEIINQTNRDEEFKYLEGKPDSCFIYVALGDWEKPVFIDNKESTRKLFDKNDKHIIAYQEMICGEDVKDYKEFDLELEYRKPYGRKPKYIVVVCTASKYGDYFVGGEGTILWVDNFRLTYE